MKKSTAYLMRGLKIHHGLHLGGTRSKQAERIAAGGRPQNAGYFKWLGKLGSSTGHSHNPQHPHA